MDKFFMQAMRIMLMQKNTKLMQLVILQDTEERIGIN